MGDISVSSGQDGATKGNKKHILINAFDMSTVGHLSPGQWKVRLMSYMCHLSLTDVESQRQISDKTHIGVLD